jgi:hypothetical protein
MDFAGHATSPAEDNLPHGAFAAIRRRTGQSYGGMPVEEKIRDAGFGAFVRAAFALCPVET